MPEAIATREANGMTTIYNDVWDGLDDEPREYDVLIASPPCQTFSTAGKGSGRRALADVLAAIADGAYKDPAALRALGEATDSRTALVLTPLAHVWRDRPPFVALEQVPAVLPVWEACADVMRGMGYSVETGILNAEQYGVPQTRRRAILVARIEGEAKLPTPTHSRYYSRTPEKLDEGVLPWVSMAEALGWGATRKPSATVTGGSSGIEWGGNADRKKMRARSVDGEGWSRKDDVEPGTNDAIRLSIEDAATLQTYPVTYTANNRLTRAAHRPVTHPATTVTGGHDSANRGFIGEDEDFRAATVEEVAALQTYPTGWGFTERPAVTVGNAVGRGLIGGSGAKAAVQRAIDAGEFIDSPHGNGETYAEKTRITVEEAAALQSYPSMLRSNYGTGGDSSKRGERLASEPAPTLTSKAGRNKWDGELNLSPEEAAALQTYPTEPRPELAAWKWLDAPATTVAGDPRITAREHHAHGEQSKTALRLTRPEASTLQTFPDEPAFVWKGAKTKQFLQIGNAVPPLLAEAVLSALIA